MGITKLLLCTNRTHYCVFQDFETLRQPSLLHSRGFRKVETTVCLSSKTRSRIALSLLTFSSTWPILYSEPAFLDNWREACLLTRYVAGHNPRLHPFSLPDARCLSI